MPRKTTPPDDAPRYWRMNLCVLGILLPLWLIVSFGLSIVWAEPLNEFYLGGFPPGFVAQVVAFGLAASSFFPIIVLGIFEAPEETAGAGRR